MAKRYDVLLVPTFLVFDGEGKERYRQVVTLPNRKAILQVVTSLSSGGEE